MVVKLCVTERERRLETDFAAAFRRWIRLEVVRGRWALDVAAAFPIAPGLCRRFASLHAANPVLATPRGPSAWAPDTDVRLTTIPRRVFVDNDGIGEPWPTESFLSFGGEPFAAMLEIPLERYEPKAALICPVKGRFMIVAGHDANEPHPGGWSQQHALPTSGSKPSRRR
jgi:hypothetical protein